MSADEQCRIKLRRLDRGEDVLRPVFLQFVRYDRELVGALDEFMNAEGVW